MTNYQWDEDDFLWDGNHCCGWVGPIEESSIFYGRTSGSREHPTVRGEFDTLDEARAFVQLMAAMGHRHGPI